MAPRSSPGADHPISAPESYKKQHSGAKHYLFAPEYSENDKPDGGKGAILERIGGKGSVRGPVQGVVPRQRHDGTCSTTLRPGKGRIRRS